MDVEMNEKMDEIMEIMHQIGTYLSDYAAAEMKGRKITKKQIENNKILETLFIRAQKLYRELSKLISQDTEQINMLGENNSDIDENAFTGILDREEVKELMNLTTNDLDEYLENAYSELRYISLNDGEGTEFEPSIYKNTKFEALRNAEYNLQCTNLERITIRDNIKRPVGKFSFKEKGDILLYIAECKFYDDYAFKQINKYILDLNKKSNNMDRKAYEELKDKLIEQKYILYFSYLNNKYNGICQENDIGKFAVIKNYIKEGLETMALNMTKFDMDENIKAILLDYKEQFRNVIKSILEKENISSKTKKEKDNLRKTGDKNAKNAIEGKDEVEIEDESNNER